MDFKKRKGFLGALPHLGLISFPFVSLDAVSLRVYVFCMFAIHH